eukprot:symbB.v1.2.023831.t1/scaffold2214.1/size85597/6
MGDLKFQLLGGGCAAICLGLLVFVIVMLASIKVVNDRQQILYVFATSKEVRNGPFTDIVWPHINHEIRDALQISTGEYAILKHERTQELRHVPGPEFVFMGAYEKSEGTGQKIVLQKQEYIRLIDQMTGRLGALKADLLVIPIVVAMDRAYQRGTVSDDEERLRLIPPMPANHSVVKNDRPRSGTETQNPQNHKVEAHEACASPEGQTDTPATASTSASFPDAVLRCISQGSYDMFEIAEDAEEQQEILHELPLSWHLLSRSLVPGVLGFSAGLSVLMGDMQADEVEEERFAAAFNALKAKEATDSDPGETRLPLFCNFLQRTKMPGTSGLAGNVAQKKQVASVSNASWGEKERDLERSESGGHESARQLSDMLMDQQVCKLLRRLQEKLRNSKVCEAPPSALRILRLLAQLQALWNVRDIWAEKPDETWGVFLERISLIMAPPRMPQLVAILPKDDWQLLRRWCLDSHPQNMERVLEACLYFYSKPGKRTAERLSRLLKQEKCGCKRSM